jgi:phosphatidate cytidylyltransferase
MSFNIREHSELTQRIIAGVLGSAIIISSIIWNEWSYFVVFFFICMLSMLEFYRLLGSSGSLPLKTFGTMNGLFLYTVTFLVEKNILDPKYYFLIFIGLSAAFLIKLYVGRDLNPFNNIALTFLGIAYIGLPFSLLHMAIFFDHNYHYDILLGSLFILWASDTGAYFSGRKFGRRKLFERISPKKTWEGFFGGAAFAMLVGFICSQVFSGSLSVWKWICISIIIVIAGTYGDLVESLFKRTIKIKDSGKSIPGHGGFLDRFDGLLIASPFIVTFLKFIE